MVEETPKDGKADEGKCNPVQYERPGLVRMLQCAVLLITVKVNGEKDKSRGCGEEWKDTKSVVIVSFEVLLIIWVDLLIKSHHCRLFIAERK